MAKLPRPVWLLGWASLFTDAGTEMIYPLLPVYLSQVLGVGAMSLGIIEGVAEGVNSALKILSGRASDRWARRKPITIAGYALSSAARPFIGVTASWTQVLGIRVIDRMGKGIRGAPRDAMLAEFATEHTRGLVFGFHRAMDHAGAVIGPLIATLFLLVLPGRYRLLFALTAIPGALAVWTLFRVPETDGAARTATVTGDSSRGAISRLPRRFYALLGILLLFSLGNSADAFLLLRLSDVLGRDAYLPLLWALLHVVKAGLSVYGGALSDRVGRKFVIVAGWCVYALVYIGFATVDSAAGLIACFLAYGIYFGLAEGSEKALVTDLSPAALRGTAFGFYNGVLGVGALAASVGFGVLYEKLGAATAFGTGAALAAVAAILLALLPTHRVHENVAA
jgi:MFS family permease